MKRIVTVLAMASTLLAANQASAGWYLNWNYQYVPQITSFTSYVPVTGYWMW